MQGKKHKKHLQKKFKWSEKEWNSLDWANIKTAFLLIEPIKQIQCSKQMHGWLNVGTQKEKISPDAKDAHKCPRCLDPNETEEHILMCPHLGAHKRQYKLILPVTQKMQPNPRCPVQQ